MLNIQNLERLVRNPIEFVIHSNGDFTKAMVNQPIVHVEQFMELRDGVLGMMVAKNGYKFPFFTQKDGLTHFPKGSANLALPEEQIREMLKRINIQPNKFQFH